MLALHKFRVVAWWSSGKSGIAKSDSAPAAIHFTAPPAFGGMQSRWTPEDLLLSSLAACYTATFRALSEHSKLNYSDLAVEVEGTVSETGHGYEFSEIFLRPTLTIKGEDEHILAWRLLEKAKTVCLVSRALSVDLKFESRIRFAGEKPSENEGEKTGTQGGARERSEWHPAGLR